MNVCELGVLAGGLLQKPDRYDLVTTEERKKWMDNGKPVVIVVTDVIEESEKKNRVHVERQMNGRISWNISSPDTKKHCMMKSRP